MYNQILVAYTVAMILLLISIVAIIFFIPIKINLKGFISSKDKKIFFASKIYSVISLLSGYIDFTNNRLIMRLKNKKAKALKYIDLLPDEVKTNFIKCFNVINFRSAILLGGEFNELKAFLCIFINSLNKTVYTALKKRKPYLNYKNDVFILEENEPSGVALMIDAVTNLFSLTKSLIKKLYGGIYNYVKGKVKQQN